MRSSRFCVAVGALVICVGGAAVHAQVAPAPTIPGKEYISEPNTNALGVPTTGQVVGWSAFGPAADTFVYGTGELDAIANVADAFIEDVIADRAALIVSLRTTLFPGGPGIDPTVGGAPASLFYRNSSPFGSSAGVWVTAPVINPVAPPANVCGVELWGPVGDTTHWSELGDGGVSVWSAAGPYLTTFEIETAIGATEGIDVDAFMMLDHAFGTDLFHVGDYALFSVRANGQFDGGEIWVLERAAGGVLTASFLVHGGVTWDTANDVGMRFGLPSFIQEIDAIEGIVPAPASIAAFGAFAWAARRRRPA